jgi:hypothetical protein
MVKCSFILRNKRNRRCRFDAVQSSLFCHYHDPSNQVAVKAKEVNEAKKRAQRKLDACSVFYERDVNVSWAPDGKEKTKTDASGMLVAPGLLPLDVFQVLKLKVEQTIAALPVTYPPPGPAHARTHTHTEASSAPDCKKKEKSKEKHLMQHAAMIQQLRSINALTRASHCVEVGAGTLHTSSSLCPYMYV